MYFVLFVMTMLLVGGDMQKYGLQSTSLPTEAVCLGPNEVRTNCYNPCEKTCFTRFRSDGKICKADCQEGCSCQPGFLKHDNGTCVQEYECSEPKCNDDEFYNSCGTCEKSCDTYNNQCTFCIAACIPDCFCKQGTIRSPDGITCVIPSECPKKTCGRNEVFDTCPNQCFSGYCQDIWSKYDCSKAPDCCEPKCVCETGNYRNKKGDCITTEECISTQAEQ